MRFTRANILLGGHVYMSTKAFYPVNEIGAGKPGFSKTRSIIEAAFYGNNVVKVNTLKEAYNLAKNSPGTIVTDMPVYRGEEFGLEPDAKVLLGYIQYSFLQEAFFKWIYGGDKLITQIPSITVEKLIKTSLNEGKITKEVAKDMKECYEKVERMWDIPHDRILPELIKFARNFNKRWFGNNKRFLYLKVFEDAESLGDFVVKSMLMIENEENFKRFLFSPFASPRHNTRYYA